MGLLDRAEQSEQTKASWKEILAGAVGILIYFGIPVFFILMLIFPSVAVALNYVFGFIAAFFLLAIVPLGLILLIFKQTRIFGGISLNASSYVLGASLWLWCFVIARFLAGVIWTIIGLLFFGLGIVPIALITSLIRTEWMIAGQIAGMLVIIFALRWVGDYFLHTPEQRQFEKDFKRFLEQYEKPLQTLRVINKVVQRKSPLIRDESILPFPQQEIYDILSAAESEANRLQYKAIEVYDNSKDAVFDKIFDVIFTSQVYLEKFVKIDAQDKERVNYFNTFDNSSDIPDEEYGEYLDLSRKYSI